MKWLALILQIISFRSSFLQSREMIESAKAVGEKGKRAAIFSGITLLALFYFLVGSATAVVELGLQIDRVGHFYWSGLLWAALSLVFFSIVVVGGATVLLKNPKPPEPAAPPVNIDLKGLLEGFAISFLSQLLDRLKDGKAAEKK